MQRSKSNYMGVVLVDMAESSTSTPLRRPRGSYRKNKRIPRQSRFYRKRNLHNYRDDQEEMGDSQEDNVSTSNNVTQAVARYSGSRYHQFGY